jgi:hypothetical protein
MTGLASPLLSVARTTRTSPVTKASGHSKVVLARFARNKRLGGACDQWAFCALKASPGARHYYDLLRAGGKAHRPTLRQVANRLVGILHVCLERGVLYDELVAWPQESQIAATRMLCHAPPAPRSRRGLDGDA